MRARLAVSRWRAATATILGALGLLAWAVPAGGTQQYETYEGVVAGSEPVAQYRFDDVAGSSTLADAVGSDTASNDGITLGNQGPFGGSKAGAFGGEAYASLASNPLEGATAFTVEAWVDWAGGSPYKEPIFDLGSGSSDYMYLTPASSLSGHTMLFEIHAGSSDVQLSVPKLAAKMWEYVAVTETGSGTLTLYVDEKEVGQIKSTTLFPSSLGHASDAYLGKSLVSGEPDFKGSLSNVAFYTKALTEEQVREHYHAAEFPVNTAPPVISGTFKEGYTLKIKENVWSGLEPFTFFYQWQRCNEKSECPNIEGLEAKEKEYKTTYQDVGSRLRVQVEAENIAGKGGPVPSAESEPIGAVAPKNTSLPTIEGEAKVGKVLKAQPGTWSGTPPKEFKYTWEVYNGKKWKEAEGSEAKEREYRVRSSQVGDTLRVAVLDENPAGSKTADSEATDTVAAGPPVNTKLPEISGTAEDGHMLSASTGTWAGTEPFSYTYQWELCNAKGEGCENILGATDASYALAASDVGHTLRMVVTATNSVASTSATSNASPLVEAIPPSNTEAPKISGTARDGQTLSASTGSWEGSPPLSYAYQWKLCNAKGEGCEEIEGATSATYALGHGDVGDTLRVTVTASNPGGEASATSQPSGVVAALAPSNTRLPTISGIERDGQTLSASTGSWEGTPPISYAYQWQSCNEEGKSCTNILGATASTYVLGHGDVGTTLRVVVTASNAAGEVSATSEASGVVEALKPSNTALPAISGTAEEGQTLSASTGSWEGTPPLTYTYQWQDCDGLGESCMNIADATDSSYVLQASDVGSTVRVVVTAANMGGSASSVSEATADVVGGAPAALIYTSQFGSEGTGPGQFAYPGGVAIEPNGDLWVSDGYNGRLEEFNKEGAYLRQVGSQGDGAGQFDYPTGLAVDSQGNLWVADTDNERVVELNDEGEYLKTIGDESGAGKLVRPDGVALDGEGDVWVTDYAQEGLRVFNNEGHYLKTVGAKGAGAGELVEPVSIAIAARHVWVADFAQDTVTEFDEQGEFLRQVGSEGSGDGQFELPAGIAVANGHVWVGDVLNDRVEEFNEQGTYLSQFGVSGSEAGQLSLSAPLGLAVDEEEGVWVTDTNNDRLERWASGVAQPPADTMAPSITGPVIEGQTLSAHRGVWAGTPPFAYSYQWQSCDGSGGDCTNITGAASSTYALRRGDVGRTVRVAVTATNAAGSSMAVSEATTVVTVGVVYTSEIGARGSEDGQFDTPTGVAVGTTGDIFVLDEGNDRIEKFSPDGEYLTQFGFEGTRGKADELYEPGGLAIGPKGDVWVTDTGNERVVEFNEQGEYIQAFKVGYKPTSIAVDAHGNLWITDIVFSKGSGENRVQVYNEQGQYLRTVGEQGSGAGEMQYPGGIAVDQHGDVWIAAEGVIPQVKEFDEAGEFRREFGAYGTGEGELSYGLDDITVDSNGDIWVADGERVEEFNENGEYISQLHSPGQTQGQFEYVGGLAANASGGVWFADTHNDRVELWAPDTTSLPVDTAVPTVTGAPEEFHTLRASTGTWEGPPVSYGYQWQDCDLAGEHCVNVTGATSAAYVPRASDVGRTVRVIVTGANTAGEASSESAVTSTVASAPAEPLCTDHWIGPTGGTWQEAPNWSTGSVPGPSDVACVGSDLTVAIDRGATRVGALLDGGGLTISGGSLELTDAAQVSSVNELMLENAALTGAGELEVAGSFTWGPGGEMSGSGSTVLEPTATSAFELTHSPAGTKAKQYGYS
ncbi:MAG TPA: 6-bladed beta-propeller [Solirubrobacteraceae bacterium]|nr:6-bladed beta-propeller [Solirubrobacteraceae bacterium]